MRFRLLAMLIIVLLLTPAACRGQDVDQLLQQATQAAERGEHDGAIAKLSEAIKASPMTPLPWYLRGREQFRTGKIAESLADFDKFASVAQELGSRHREYGVQASHYPVVRDALVDALAETLGDAFDSQTARAWCAAFDLAAEEMQYGATT